MGTERKMSTGYYLFELALCAWMRTGSYDTDYIDWDRADALTLSRTAFSTFEAMLSGVRFWYRPSINVSDSGGLELANAYDAVMRKRGQEKRAFRTGIPYDGITCLNWDSLIPQPTYDSTGRHAGMIMPRMRQDQIAATPGIQSWSAPLEETRTR